MCTSRSSSTCCSGGRCGSRRYWPDDDRTAVVPSDPPRRMPLRRLRHSDGQWPSIPGVSRVTAEPVHIDDEERGPRMPTSLRSCLSH